jgi:hypothetical protein
MLSLSARVVLSTVNHDNSNANVSSSVLDPSGSTVKLANSISLPLPRRIVLSFLLFASATTTLPALTTVKSTVFLEADPAGFPSSSSPERVTLNLPSARSFCPEAINHLAFTSAVTTTSTDSPALTFTFLNESLAVILVPLSLTSATDDFEPSMYK